jgi:hypothetical protein
MVRAVEREFNRVMMRYEKKCTLKITIIWGHFTPISWALGKSCYYCTSRMPFLAIEDIFLYKWRVV